jgi:hypothetical protein
MPPVGLEDVQVGGRQVSSLAAPRRTQPAHLSPRYLRAAAQPEFGDTTRPNFRLT